MMRNCAHKMALLALASLFALWGVALAGDNAGVTFSLSTPSTVSGVGPGQAINIGVSAVGLVSVKQIQINFTIEPAGAFNISWDGTLEELSANPFYWTQGLAGYIGSEQFGPDSVSVTEYAVGGAGAARSGDRSLGTLKLTTSATFTTGTTATVRVTAISIGQSPDLVDNFAADVLTALTTTLNPPAPAPTISAIAPTSGLVTGGTAVTIIGADFQSGATVTIDSVAATSVVFVSDDTLTAVTPAGAVGAANVVVTNPDGKSAELLEGFTYIGIIEPALTAVSAADFSLDFSPVGKGSLADNSAGEVAFAVSFKDSSGAAAAGQAIAFAITNNGAESVFVLATPVVTVAAGATQTVTVNTAADGSASVKLDAEGDKTAGSTSVAVVTSTTAPNSQGVSRSVSGPAFSASWSVPVAAELASFAAATTPTQGVLLQWTVASQSNNLGWEVFRSVDKVRFEKVSGLIPGDGTTDQLKTYSALDENVPAVDVVYYYLKQIDLDGTTARSSVIEVVLSQPLPTVSALWQNFPNPFNPETTISFDLSAESVVSLTIYDATGQVVRTLVEGQSMTAGHYRQLWDGRNEMGVKVGSGVYFYQLKAGDFTSIKKMTLVQ